LQTQERHLSSKLFSCEVFADVGNYLQVSILLIRLKFKNLQSYVYLYRKKNSKELNYGNCLIGHNYAKVPSLKIGSTLSNLQQINSEKDAGCPVFQFPALANWGVQHYRLRKINMN